jgi:hypothetical protein
MRLVCEDEAYGPANRDLIGDWVAELLPRAVTAARTLLGDDGPPDGLEEATTWLAAQLDTVGIPFTAVDLKK